MPRKKKPACERPVKEKPIAINDNEEAFLNFIVKNARQGIDLVNIVDQNSRRSSDINKPNFTDNNVRKSSGLRKPNPVDESATQGSGFGELGANGSHLDYRSDSSASEASLTRSGGQFCVGGNSGESPYAKGGQKATRKRSRPSKTGKESKNGVSMQENSLNVMNASSSNAKQAEVLLQDPRYSKDELKACLAVVKKVMEMEEAISFNSPVDPVALEIPDYFNVIDTPMDFGTICNNLRNGLKYANAEDVYNDVRHIWDNCLKYNKKGDYIVYLMKIVKKKFLKNWTAAGLQCDFPGKTTSSVCQVQQGNPELESDVVLPAYSNPYQSHDFHLHQRTIQEQQFSRLQTNCSHQVEHSCLVPLSDHSMRCSKCNSTSTTNMAVGTQARQDSCGTHQTQQPQVSPLSNNQPYQLSQSHPHASQEALVSSSQDDTNSNHAACESACKMSNISGAQTSSAGLDPEIALVSGHSLSQQSSKSGSQDQSDQPQQYTCKTRKRNKVRGPTLCRDLWDTHESERIVVPVNKLGQPVGPEASKLSTFLGTVARNGEMTPLTYVNWSAMPDENKEDMWQFVQKKFHIDPIGKTWVMKSLASKWRNWKANLKAEYYYPYNTDEDRLKVRDERVCPDQWPILISYWNSEKVMLRSAKNKENRAKQKTVHTTGQKSYARIREEERAKRPDGKEPTRVELFIKTHTRKTPRARSGDASDFTCWR